MSKFISIIKLARPSQWTKNLFIFMPVFFGAKFTDVHSLKQCTIAFLSFSLIASSMYAFNDIVDVELDKLHPKKKNRPIASGELTKREGYFIMGLLLAFGLFTIYVSNIGIDIFIVAITYYILNLAYTIKLKNYAIIDVTIIATGFIFRLLIGSYAGDVKLSHWIIIMTFLLALFMAFAKRRDEFDVFIETGKKPRQNIARYNRLFLDTALSIIATVTIVAYINYTVSPDVVMRISDKLYFTSAFVILGILRYMLITLVDNNSSNPTKILLTDRFIQFCIFAWIGLFVFLLYADTLKTIINEF